LAQVTDKTQRQELSRNEDRKKKNPKFKNKFLFLVKIENRRLKTFLTVVNLAAL
jgi:hypothetical protein